MSLNDYMTGRMAPLYSRIAGLRSVLVLIADSVVFLWDIL